MPHSDILNCKTHRENNLQPWKPALGGCDHIITQKYKKSSFNLKYFRITVDV
jgi:hypothetical protein